MRKRFLAGGLEGYADHEALELLLYYAIPRRDTNPIAHALMERYGSLSAVLSAPVEDLQKVEGIGESAAILIRLALLLCRKARLEDAARATALNSTERAGKYLIELFAQEKREILYQLCLDQKGKLLACKRLSVGSANGADLDVRLLVENAVQNFQPFGPVQHMGGGSHHLEVAQQVGFNAFQSRPCRFQIVRLNGERQVLGLDDAVVAPCQLPL